MKQYVLMNKKTGLSALGMKLQLFDGPEDQIMQPTELGKIAWLPKDPDFWAISTSDGGAFMVLPFTFVNTEVEVLCEL